MVHKYNTEYRNADAMHIINSTKDIIGQSVENWTLKEPMSVKNINGTIVSLPIGTWMTTIKIEDDNTWERIESGELRGFSAMYVPKTQAELFKAEKRTLVAELEDPVPVSIAVVDKPCVFDAIFTSVKTNYDKKDSYEGLRNSINASLREQFKLKDFWIKLTFKDSVIIEMFDEDQLYEIPYTIDESSNVTLGEAVEVEEQYVTKKWNDYKKSLKAGRRISNSTLGTLQKAYDTAKDSLDNLKNLLSNAENERNLDNSQKNGEIDMDEEKLKNLIGEAVKAEVKPLNDEIASIKEEMNKEPALKCVKCEHELADAVKFCPECGDEIKQEEAPVEGAEKIKALEDKVEDLKQQVNKSNDLSDNPPGSPGSKKSFNEEAGLDARGCPIK